MKKVLALIAGILFLMAGTVWAAPFLVCDPNSGATMYQLEIDGIEVAVDYLAEPDGSIHFDMAPYAGGQHTLRARARNLWMYGDWSVPFDFNADGPGAPSGYGFSAE